jgi:hypothetical protein
VESGRVVTGLISRSGHSSRCRLWLHKVGDAVSTSELSCSGTLPWRASIVQEMNAPLLHRVLVIEEPITNGIALGSLHVTTSNMHASLLPSRPEQILHEDHRTLEDFGTESLVLAPNFD